MRAYPNFKSYHDLIEKYLDIEPNLGFSLGNVDSKPFFFELIYRSMNEIIKGHEYDGIGDLNRISLDLIQDFNTPYVGVASQKMVNIREPHAYGAQNLSEEISKFLSKFDFGRDDITMQYLQENAGMQLLDMYFRGNPRKAPLMPEEMPIGSFVKSRNWKGLRCPFYRYLMYCGFVQVDSFPRIKEDSIPRLDLLTKLADRFMNKYHLRETYEMYKAKPEGDILDPKELAEGFLNFNGISLEEKV